MCEKFQVWLKQQPKDHRHEWVAEQIGVTPSAVYRYADGTRIPGRETMPKLVKLTGGAVTANEFFGIEEADLSSGEAA